MARLKSGAGRLKKITPTISDMPHGAKENQAETAVEKIIELENELSKDMLELISTRLNIQRAIDGIHNETYRLLLEYHYIHGMTWEQIAVEMSYTYQWVYTLHGRALKEWIIIDTQRVI